MTGFIFVTLADEKRSLYLRVSRIERVEEAPWDTNTRCKSVIYLITDEEDAEPFFVKDTIQAIIIAIRNQRR